MGMNALPLVEVKRASRVSFPSNLREMRTTIAYGRKANRHHGALPKLRNIETMSEIKGSGDIVIRIALSHQNQVRT